VDVAHSEMVEKELDAMIRRRHDHRVKDEGERLEEALWRESVERYNTRQKQEKLWEELRYHDRMIRAHTANFEAIIGTHAAELARCEELLGLNGHHKESAGA
jgi:hypothetical protein